MTSAKACARYLGSRRKPVNRPAKKSEAPDGYRQPEQTVSFEVFSGYFGSPRNGLGDLTLFICGSGGPR